MAGRVAVLASGGLDSSVLIAELARQSRSQSRRVFPIYVQAGLRWERVELAVLRRFIRALDRETIEPVTVLRLPMSDLARDHWSVTGRGVPGYRAAISSNYIVGRNLGLLSKAAIFCALNRIGEIAIATLKANPFPDASPRFFRAFASAVRLGIGARPQAHHSVCASDEGGGDRARFRSAASTHRLVHPAPRDSPLRRVHEMRRTRARLPRRRRRGSHCVRSASPRIIVSPRRAICRRSSPAGAALSSSIAIGKT